MKEISYQPLGRYLSIVYRAINSLLDEQLAPYAISRGQFPILMALYQQEGVSQQDLVKFYQLDKAAVGRAVNKLVDSGFIRRQVDSDDRRQYLLFLTKKAVKLKPDFLNILKITEETMVNGLSKEEIRLFTDTINKIIKNLGISNLEEHKLIN